MDETTLRGWIGRKEEASDVVTPRLCAEFVATFAPHLATVAAEAAPLGLHWCLAPDLAPAAALGQDGHRRRGGLLPPAPLPRRMWAGGEIETLAPLRLGDVVTRRSLIEAITAKSGRSGRLCFVTVRHEYATGRGIAIRERQDLVYREATASGAKQPARIEAPGASEPAWTIDATPVLLFRYSAMTFNGHRIHYDLSYVTGEEAYGGLVVHGPLQATFLLNMAARRLGAVPASFRYRGRAPLLAGSRFSVAARDDGGGVACWTEGANGVVHMVAEASLSPLQAVSAGAAGRAGSGARPGDMG